MSFQKATEDDKKRELVEPVSEEKISAFETCEFAPENVKEVRIAELIPESFTQLSTEKTAESRPTEKTSERRKSIKKIKKPKQIALNEVSSTQTITMENTESLFEPEKPEIIEIVPEDETVEIVPEDEIPFFKQSSEKHVQPKFIESFAKPMSQSVELTESELIKREQNQQVHILTSLIFNQFNLFFAYF